MWVNTSMLNSAVQGGSELEIKHVSRCNKISVYTLRVLYCNKYIPAEVHCLLSTCMSPFLYLRLDDARRVD